MLRRYFRTIVAALMVAAFLPPATVQAQDAGARTGRTEWLLTATPVGIGASRVLSGPLSAGLAILGPALSVAVAGDSQDDADRLVSAALTIDLATGPVVWRIAPAAVVMTGNDWSQVYPGFHAGARTYVRLLGLDIALGADLSGVRIAGGNGSGTWSTWVAPLVGVRL